MIKRFKTKYLPILLASFKQSDIFGNAAQLSYYLLLALVPTLILLANMIPLLPMGSEQVLGLATQILPEPVSGLLLPTLRQYLNSVNLSVISVSTLALIWSGSTGFTSLQRILKKVYGQETQANFLVIRILSFLFATALVLAVGFLSFFYIFGESLFVLLKQNINIPVAINELVEWLINFQWLWLLLGIFAFNLFINQVVPLHGRPLKYQWGGALISSLALFIINDLFNVYVRYFVGSSLTQSTIGIFIVMMIWLYLSCAAVLAGAAVNEMLYRVLHRELRFNPHSASLSTIFSFFSTGKISYELASRPELVSDPPAVKIRTNATFNWSDNHE